MEQKIYVEGLGSTEDEQKTASAVLSVQGVSHCVVSYEKAQVFVTYDEKIPDIEHAIRNAIQLCGFDVLG
ncbi:heavy-metal-associated domain-containing protein [Treponema sp. OMZ 840]|uniref:cation transporter n=1 Tax=Treponema sp. OMZ 840 TaxID=244313 RepID=UPI003D8EAF2A